MECYSAVISILPSVRRVANNTLIELKQSPATSKGKVKIILATDGVEFVAEDLNSGETVACAYGDFANHFGFFLTLAGITTTKEIRNNAVDIQAKSKDNFDEALNRTIKENCNILRFSSSEFEEE